MGKLNVDIYVKILKVGKLGVPLVTGVLRLGKLLSRASLMNSYYPMCLEL